MLISSKNFNIMQVNFRKFHSLGKNQDKKLETQNVYFLGKKEKGENNGQL